MCFITRATQLQFCGVFFIICQQFKLSLCVYVCIYVLFAVLKWLMTSAGRTFTTPVQQQLQLLPLLFKVRTNTHTHTGSSTALLPTQSYLPIKLNFSLHLLKMVRCSLSFYLSPSLSLCFLSPPADCPGGDWWELWWDEAGCTHVSLSHVSGPAVSWAHPSGFGCTGRGNMYTQIQKYSQKHTLTTASPACCQCSKPNLPRYCVRLKTTYAILISLQIFCGEFLCEWYPCCEIAVLKLPSHQRDEEALQHFFSFTFT